MTPKTTAAVKAKKVQTIPATLGRFTSAPIASLRKRKVAGYAQGSTDHDDQFRAV